MIRESAIHCESAPKRDPSSDSPQLLDTTKEFLFRLGSRSVPIGTLTSGVLADDFSDLLCFGQGPASVLIHTLAFRLGHSTAAAGLSLAWRCLSNGLSKGPKASVIGDPSKKRPGFSASGMYQDDLPNDPCFYLGALD